MTVLTERRQFKRFDSFMVVECKPVSKPVDSLLGITRNFSYGGFNFESQDLDLEPGDNLNFTLRNNERNLSVSDVGQIVWKRKTSDFDCSMGMSFEEISSVNRRKVLELVSATENVHISSLLPQALPIDDQYREQERDLNGGGVERTDVRTRRRTDRRKTSLNTPVIMTVTVIVLFVLLIVFNIKRKNSDILPPAAEIAVPPQDIPVEPPPLKIIENAVIPPSNNSQATQTIDRFYIQVGAWKVPLNARRMLDQLQKYYPEAYLIEERTFNMIRIPGISSREQGTIITRDIEEKFKIKPILIENK